MSVMLHSELPEMKATNRMVTIGNYKIRTENGVYFLKFKNGTYYDFYTKNELKQGLKTMIKKELK